MLCIVTYNYHNQKISKIQCGPCDPKNGPILQIVSESAKPKVYSKWIRETDSEFKVNYNDFSITSSLCIMYNDAYDSSDYDERKNKVDS